MSQIGLSSSTTVPIAATAAAENYQLKWHSHISNLNSSVCNLYKNDKYADVMLYTCNSNEESFNGSGIPAHKLILGTCSHYFSSIFDNNPMPINTMTYIVLPPDLSKRAVLTLIQYMYTGEATVSNDILNEVLKGGEILKIRGLCKVHPNNETVGPKHHGNDGNQQSSYQSFRIMENGGIKSNKTTPRNSIDKKLPDSRSASQILTQQESPVLVMASPNQNYAQQMQQSCPQSTSSNSNQQPNRINQQPQGSQSVNTQASTIIVKKDVAIDPGDNKIPIEHYGLVSLQIAAGLKKAQQNNLRRASNPTSGTTPMGEHRRSSSPMNNFHQGDIFPNEEILGYETPSPTSFKIFNTNHSTEQLEEEILRYTEKKKRIAQNNKQMATATSVSTRENQKNYTKYVRLENNSNNHHQYAQTSQISSKNVQIPEALNFLTIKEEPAEWTEFENDNAAMTSMGSTSNVVNVLDAKKTEIITVKPETYDPNETSMDSESADKVFSPLTCEICNETFQLPADWVRHTESHSELTAQHVPKKRRRVEDEEDSENIAALSCDLCDNIHFQSPAEWVRHVQNTHTETELAMSNNSILTKKANSKQPKESPTDKACSICKKTFPSSASMLIHKRTHTGEKPFYCIMCNKGFNVKSNLLRHMRTLHNQINTLNDNQEDSNSDSNSME